MKLGRYSVSVIGSSRNNYHSGSCCGSGIITKGVFPCRCNTGRNYRHMVQGLIVFTVFCTVLLFQISLMTIQSSSGRDVSDNNLAVENDGNSIAMNNARLVNKDLHSSDFAPETSGANYNYLYNDGDNYNDNQVDEIETTRQSSGNSGGVNNEINDSKKQLQTDTFVSNNNAASALHDSTNDISKGVNMKSTNKRKNQNTRHYKTRQKLLDSVFISVKTTKRFHSTRLEPILRTWFNLAREQTWIFTDADDPVLNRRTGGHMINTNCPATHYRQALCCKMSAEFDTFIQSGKSWFCHVDDDNYVNIPALLDLVEKHDPKEYHYLGKPSLKSPIHFNNPENKSEEVSFWFGTGGAGFCLSRALALRMSPLASGGKFSKLCDRIQLPDDVTIGYVAGHLLGQNLTVIPQFHSHFETMKFIDMKNPHPEITFSYVRYGDHVNILDVKGFFTEEEDPTRFLSLHCLLFPNFSFCPKGASSKR